MKRSQFALPILALTSLVLISGCSDKAKLQKYQKRADEYFQAGQFDQARIEYQNALRIDPQNAEAVARLGVIWFDQGAPIQALPFLVRSRELSPDNIEARTKLGYTLLSVGQQPEARKEAITLFEKAPTNDEVLRLLIDSSQNPDDLADTESRLQSSTQPDRAALHLAQAGIAVRKPDLIKAVNEVQKALEMDPKSPTAQLAMGNLYLQRGEKPRALEHFKTAASLSPVRSLAHLKVAELQAQSGDIASARALLTDLTKKAPDYLPAWGMLAQISAAEKKYDEALALLQNIFGRDTGNFDGRMQEAQIKLAKGDLDGAIETLEHLNNAYDKAPMAKLQLARAYTQKGELPKAISTLGQALTISPGYPDAVMLQADLRLRTGEFAPVVADMQALLKNRPGLSRAQLNLAEAYRGLGQLDAAADVFREQIKATPEAAQPHFLLGMILRQQTKNPEARAEFEKSLSFAPDNLIAIYQLVDLDLQEKKFDDAERRVKSQLEKAPKAVGAQFLEARVLAAKGDWQGAEVSLNKTLDLDPNFSSAYDLLVTASVANNRVDNAIARLGQMLEKNPTSERGLMLSGLLHARKGDIAPARAAYEKLIAINPNFAPALNNLACLYFEAPKDLDKALDLARKAHQLQPSDPAIADTLGWALHQRGDYPQALTLLRESVEKLGQNPQVQYHLGLTYHMMGQADSARPALEFAANSAEDFAGKEDAKRILGTGASESITDLETALQARPDDVPLLLRAAEAYEKDGAFAKAAAACERALKSNPKLVTATVKLAELNAGPLKNHPAALDLAAKARSLAASDPAVTARLADVAYKARNFAWSYTLSQEAATQLADNAPAQLVFARAAFAAGNVPDAVEALEKVRKLAPNENSTKEASSFLKFAQLLQQSAPISEADNAEAEKVIQGDPENLPALMIRAARTGQQLDASKAQSLFEAILKQFPDFALAQKQLAALYVADPARRTEAHELAVKARKTLASDPELTLILAETSYHRKDFAYAIQLFKESAQTKPLTAESLFLLGMAYAEKNDAKAAVDTLKKALESGLKAPADADARRKLSELGTK